MSYLDTPPDQVPLYTPGTLLAGRYKVVDPLALSAVGVIYRIHDELLDRELAAKTLRPEIAREPDARERFRREFSLASRIRHRHVVRYHEILEHEGDYVITMQLVPGLDMEEVIERDGRIGGVRVLQWIAELGSALERIHQKKIVHGDVKPANVLLDAEGGTYLTDFGAARSAGGTGRLREAAIVGSPYFMSPEQARGEELDARSDIYSFGILLLQALAGRLPFEDGEVDEILSRRRRGEVDRSRDLGIEAPSDLLDALDRCTEPERDRRMGSVSEILSAARYSGGVLYLIHEEGRNDESQDSRAGRRYARYPTQHGVEVPRSSPRKERESP